MTIMKQNCHDGNRAISQEKTVNQTKPDFESVPHQIGRNTWMKKGFEWF
jgi:hypothetical protein